MVDNMPAEEVLKVPSEPEPMPVPEPTMYEVPEEPPPRRVKGHSLPESSPKPTQIEKADRLELENNQLKLENIQLQLQIMQSDLAKALTTRNQLVEAMKKMRVLMQEKYGVDIAAVKIDDAGNFTPLTQTGPITPPQV